MTTNKIMNILDIRFIIIYSIVIIINIINYLSRAFAGRHCSHHCSHHGTRTGGVVQLHGQGQRAFPHRHLPSHPPRHQGPVDSRQPSLLHRSVVVGVDVVVGGVAVVGVDGVVLLLVVFCCCWC